MRSGSLDLLSTSGNERAEVAEAEMAVTGPELWAGRVPSMAHPCVEPGGIRSDQEDAGWRWAHSPAPWSPCLPKTWRARSPATWGKTSARQPSKPYAVCVSGFDVSQTP